MNYNVNDLKNALVSQEKSPFNKTDVTYEAKMIMYRILSEVEEYMEQNSMTKKELAKLVGTSPSYITQLYRGSKLLNLPTLAKLQMALKILFDIKAISDFRNEESYFNDEIIIDDSVLKLFDSKCHQTQSFKEMGILNYYENKLEDPKFRKTTHKETPVQKIAA